MRSHGKRQQHGAILLALLLLFTMVGLSLLIKGLSSTEATAARDRKTAMAMAKAKEAIIGFAASSTTLPGRLPCPEDTSLIDSLNEGNQRSSCSNTAPSIGRLPWRTLKSDRLRDAYEEPLWYVVSPGFRSAPINSTTPGQLTIDAQLEAYAALIIAPGPPLSGQSRGTVSASSPPLVANYLDGTNVDGNNSFSVNGTGINDRILGITVAELMAPVGQRVLSEIRGPDVNYGLRNFHNVNGYFPYANTDPPLPDGTIDGAANGTETLGTPPYDVLAPAMWLNSNKWWALVSYERINLNCVRLSLSGGAPMYAVPCTATPCQTNICP